ncbi:hypothetical protein GC105_05915 [Alkalibaculum sp. M08DMB]|uniref:Uncharacterized protein n=1 Tax=Alkalibaculum sporogenes TaxID=2655001 RepID=A0A6A7K761_9FIRM|nr:hypothetical protein [Alkalibaculum sporogenes]MPW25318.1 hypothetical protein [Alkalibaculum sporogenes]
MSLSKKSKLRTVLNNPEGKLILENYFSEALKSPLLKMALGYTIEELAQKAGKKNVPDALLEQIDIELRKI